MEAGPSTNAAVNIPGFELVEVIHESGPRVIYRAVREADGEEVILKTLLARYPRKQDVAEIRREFRIANELNIDGVIRMHSLVTYGSGNLAIEMEPFGLSLADFMARRKGQPLTHDRFFSIAELDGPRFEDFRLESHENTLRINPDSLGQRQIPPASTLYGSRNGVRAEMFVSRSGIYETFRL